MVYIIINVGLSNELAKTNDSCNNSCNENATCVDGECQCKPGYVGNGKVCLPGGLFTEIKPTVVLTTNEGTYFNNRLNRYRLLVEHSNIDELVLEMI